MQTLRGRTCVFAGATAGDGIDAVRELCSGGMNVVMTTHMVSRAKALEDEINKMGLPGKCLAAGETQEGPAESSPSLYRMVREKFGSVDVIIHNTGTTGPDIPMEKLEASVLMETVSHLTAGAFNMLRAALPYLRKSRSPRVIFMSSVEGVKGGIHESFANAVAKGAVQSLALNAAARLAAEGICVNCIAKGAIPRAEGIRPGDADPAGMLSSIPMGRLGTPGDLAHLTAFLASEESAYITGQVICLAGGYDLLCYHSQLPEPAG